MFVLIVQRMRIHIRMYLHVRISPKFLQILFFNNDFAKVEGCSQTFPNSMRSRTGVNRGARLHNRAGMYTSVGELHGIRSTEQECLKAREGIMWA